MEIVRIDDAILNSDELHIFFSYYFQDYSIKKLNKSSDFYNWGFIAYDDNKKIIGAIKGEIMWNVIHIDLLMIKPEYRKQGIGTKLYDLVLDFAKKKKCVLITVETFDFQAPIFWKSKGFTFDFSRSGYDDNTLHFLSIKLNNNE
jgi:ribosomal protein S18 acetylase RimI-like enzyme